MNTYEVCNLLSGHSFGLFAAKDAAEACDLCTQEAGYKDVADMETQLGERSTLVAHERQRINTAQANLLAWVNTHDCCVHPCGIPNNDGSITVRVECVNADGKTYVDETVVRTYQEARDALGY